MATVQQHVEHAAASLDTALFDLECALSHAKARRYQQNWINAIIDALNQTRAAHLQTGNTATCLRPHADPPP